MVLRMEYRGCGFFFFSSFSDLRSCSCWLAGDRFFLYYGSRFFIRVFRVLIVFEEGLGLVIKLDGLNRFLLFNCVGRFYFCFFLKFVLVFLVFSDLCNSSNLRSFRRY